MTYAFPFLCTVFQQVPILVYFLSLMVESIGFKRLWG